MTNIMEKITNGSPINVTKLKRLYKANEAAKNMFDYFAGRKNNMSQSTVDRLLSALVNEGHTVTRSQIIGVLKELTTLQCGEFKNGRKKQPSRMLWSVGIVSLGQAASGQTEKVEDFEQDSEESEIEAVGSNAAETDFMNISYPLRAELMTELTLPKNLTQKEANRLADFIKTLPFGDLPSDIG